MIVVGKLIHGNLNGRCGKACAVVAHGAPEAFRIAEQILTVIVTVLQIPSGTRLPVP